MDATASTEATERTAEDRRMPEQGDVALLDDPVARELLASRIPARLAYAWKDGTPRVIPIWFHWDGREVVVGTPPAAPKLRALRQGSRVAVTIDTETPPYHALMIRGSVSITRADAPTEDYAASARRYMGDAAGDAQVAGMRESGVPMTRISIKPDWVGIIDFERRFPSAMGG